MRLGTAGVLYNDKKKKKKEPNRPPGLSALFQWARGTGAEGRGETPLNPEKYF